MAIGRKIRRAGNWASGLAILCAAALFAMWAVGRLVAFGETVLAENPWMGAAMGFETCFASIAAAPFDFGPTRAYAVPLLGTLELPSPWVLGAWAGVLAVILAVCAYARAVRLKGDFTGKEHGDGRLADRSEMRRFADKRHFCNNVLYSKRFHLAVNARNRHLRNVTKGTNMHCLILGPSGAGKTLHYAIPDILQSLGARVRPLPSTGPAGTAAALWEHASRKQGGGIDVREPAERWGQGYDLVVTDLKGELTEMFGEVIEATGGQMRVFDVKTFEGCHYNPFDPRYLPTRLTDCCDPGQVQCEFGVRCGEDERMCDYPASISEEPSRLTFASPEGACSVEVRLDMETAQTSALETGDGESSKLVKEALSRMDDTFADECRQWAAMDEAARQGTTMVNPAEVVRSFRYNRTAGAINVFVHLPAGATELSAPFELRMELDPHLDVEEFCGSVGRVEVSETGHGRILSWTVQPGEWHGGRNVPPSSTYCICATAKVAPMRVADGGMLLRVVQCMVDNLGAEGESNGKNDAFWTGTKVMKLTSHVAYLVEAYDAKYRNLPEMIRMIDMCKPEDRESKSEVTAMEVLMREWERGEVFETVEAQDAAERSDMGVFAMSDGATVQGRWVLRKTPHSEDRSLAVRCYKAYKGGAGDTVSSINITVDEAITKICPEEVRDMLRDDELHLDRLGMGGAQRALFIQTDQFDPTFAFLVSLVVFQTFNAIAKNADAHGGKVPRHVRFVLDEFVNSTGRIPAFNAVVSIARSLNFSLCMFIQSLAQLKEAYGEDVADTIRDNVWAIIMLGGEQKAAALEEISKLLGTKTVYAKTQSVSRNGGQVIGATSVSESVQSHERPVMSVSELTNLADDYSVIIPSKQHGVLDKRVNPFKHPLYPYVYSSYPRKLTSRAARVTKPYDFRRSLAAMRAARAAGRDGPERRGN